MTDEQKEKIRSMRIQGIGYRLIAKELCLKENQVQLFCKAHGLVGSADLTRLNYPIWCYQNNRCLVCGAKLKQAKHGRKKKFCSGKCRTKYCRSKSESETEE